MAPKLSYLKIFSLQAGSCITTSVGATLMIIVFFYNISAKGCEYCMNQNLQHGLLFIYTAIMMCGFFVASTGSYKVRPETLQNGTTVIILGFVLWLILSIVSFIPLNGMYKLVCINNRCPETHWMYNTKWRDYGDICAPEETKISSQVGSNSTSKLLAASDSNIAFEKKSWPKLKSIEKSLKTINLTMTTARIHGARTDTTELFALRSESANSTAAMRDGHDVERIKESSDIEGTETMVKVMTTAVHQHSSAGILPKFEKSDSQSSDCEISNTCCGLYMNASFSTMARETCFQLKAEAMRQNVDLDERRFQRQAESPKLTTPQLVVSYFTKRRRRPTRPKIVTSTTYIEPILTKVTVTTRVITTVAPTSFSIITTTPTEPSTTKVTTATSKPITTVAPTTFSEITTTDKSKSDSTPVYTESSLPNVSGVTSERISTVAPIPAASPTSRITVTESLSSISKPPGSEVPDEESSKSQNKTTEAGTSALHFETTKPPNLHSTSKSTVPIDPRTFSAKFKPDEQSSNPQPHTTEGDQLRVTNTRPFKRSDWPDVKTDDPAAMTGSLETLETRVITSNLTTTASTQVSVPISEPGTVPDSHIQTTGARTTQSFGKTGELSTEAFQLMSTPSPESLSSTSKPFGSEVPDEVSRKSQNETAEAVTSTVYFETTNSSKLFSKSTLSIEPQTASAKLRPSEESSNPQTHTTEGGQLTVTNTQPFIKHSDRLAVKTESGTVPEASKSQTETIQPGTSPLYSGTTKPSALVGISKSTISIELQTASVKLKPDEQSSNPQRHTTEGDQLTVTNTRPFIKPSDWPDVKTEGSAAATGSLEISETRVVTSKLTTTPATQTSVRISEPGTVPSSRFQTTGARTSQSFGKTGESSTEALHLMTTPFPESLSSTSKPFGSEVPDEVSRKLQNETTDAVVTSALYFETTKSPEVISKSTEPQNVSAKFTSGDEPSNSQVHTTEGDQLTVTNTQPFIKHSDWLAVKTEQPATARYPRRSNGRRPKYIICKVHDLVYMILSGVLFVCQCCFMIYGINKLLDFKKALLLGHF